MALETCIIRSNPRQPRGYVPRLPHPSWRRAVAGETPPSATVMTPRDFWERLGL